LGRIRRKISAPPQELMARVAHHDRAIADIVAALQPLQAGAPLDTGARLGALDAMMPRLLNTISSQEGLLRQNRRELNSLGDEVARLATQSMSSELGEIWTRIEMVRREILFELRYAGGSATSTADSSGTFEPSVINQAHVNEASANGLRLNLGAGHVALDGYVNVDMRELPGVDIVARLDDLPVEPHSVVEIFSSHVLEHFPVEQLDRQMLPYWVTLLAPGGVFRAVVPDGGAMLAGYSMGSVSYEHLREVIFGGQEYEGDFHFDLFTTDTLSRSLERAGLVDIEIEAEGRPNGICLEFQIAARKPV